MKSNCPTLRVSHTQPTAIVSVLLRARTILELAKFCGTYMANIHRIQGTCSKKKEPSLVEPVVHPSAASLIYVGRMGDYAESPENTQDRQCDKDDSSMG